MDTKPDSPAEAEFSLKTWQRPFLGLILFGLWLGFCGLQIVLHNDDAMRLVQVRDLLAGQGWFDLSQSRLGLDGGTAMHWSRLIDAPLAGMMLLLAPLVGQAGAEAAVMILWPALLFAGTIIALAATCHRLGGTRAGLAGGFLAAVMLGWGGKFDAGSLDHHNIQLLLLAVGLAGFVYRNDNRHYAAIAGVALGLSLGIGVETLPLIGVLCLAFALAWGVYGDAERDAAVAFSLTLSASLAVIFIFIVPAEAWAGGFCDALSRDLALPIIVGCAGLGAAVVSLPEQSRGSRIAVLACLGVVVVAATARFAPACLTNPYAALDPVLQEKWLSRVAEAQSLIGASAAWKGFFAGGVIGLMVAIVLAVRSEHKAAWWTVASLLAVSLVMGAVQIRGLSIVGALGIIPTAVLIARLANGEPVRAPVVALAAVVLSVPVVPSALAKIGLSPVKTGIAAPAVTVTSALPPTGVPCTAASDLYSLSKLPTGTVAAPPYFGAHILLHTPHRVLAAPYHRNQAGLLAQLDLAYAPSEQTLEMLRMHKVDYVVRCAGDRQFERENPGLAAHLSPNAPAPFLVPVQSSGPLSIYRVAAPEVTP